MTKNAKQSDCVLDESTSTPDAKDEANHITEPTVAGLEKVAKNRKKSDCNVHHVLRALNTLTTPEEKLAAMCQKYADLFDENRKLQNSLKQSEKQVSIVTKEKDQIRGDLSQTVLSRSRLENLCRELQRRNKEIKDESFQKIREEEEKRKEVSAKFQTTLNEITELMKEDNDKTMKLRDDNIDMTSKLKSIYEQYGIREQQMEKMTKQMALESQLYEARLAKIEMETSAEKEILLREKQQLLVTLTEYQAKFQEYQNIEVALRNQVALYNSKYEEFEKSLTRSNKMFTGFKEEMENMSSKIVKLESETLAWKQRWEKTQKALVEMAAEKQKSDHEVILAAKQMGTLHKLCRTLQMERAQLLSKLKELGSTTDFEATLENVFVENPVNACTDDAKDADASAEGVNECQRNNNKSADRKKSRQAKTSPKNDSTFVENTGESIAVESQPLLDPPEFSSKCNVSTPSIKPENNQLNGSSSPPETEDSSVLKREPLEEEESGVLNAEQSHLEKDTNSETSILKKTNKNSPKKKNKK